MSKVQVDCRELDVRVTSELFRYMRDFGSTAYRDGLIEVDISDDTMKKARMMDFVTSIGVVARPLRRATCSGNNVRFYL